MIKTFYVVWNESNGNPTFKHETYTSAEVEAKRLAKHSPGEKFHVLASCCTLEVPEPVTKTVHVPELEDIPF